MAIVLPDKPSRRYIYRDLARRRALVSVSQYETTDTPRAMTAHLHCGHSRRYDVGPFGRLPAIIRCRTCEEAICGLCEDPR